MSPSCSAWVRSKESSNIDLIINMVPWRDGEAYDRLGMETQYTEILDVKVPSITVPITPGRNLAVIFEVAAMNNRQKRMGYNAAVEFTEQMSKYFTARNDDWKHKRGTGWLVPLLFLFEMCYDRKNYPPGGVYVEF